MGRAINNGKNLADLAGSPIRDYHDEKKYVNHGECKLSMVFPKKYLSRLITLTHTVAGKISNFSKL